MAEHKKWKRRESIYFISDTPQENSNRRPLHGSGSLQHHDQCSYAEATAVRTVVVVAMAWGMVFLTHAQSGIAASCRKINARTIVMTTLNLSIGTTLDASPSCSAL